MNKERIMNTITEINMADLHKEPIPDPAAPAGINPLQNPEVEENLFKFKQGLINLIKEDFSHVVITNKTKETARTTPYYQIIVGKKNIIIKDVIGDVVQRNIVYQWNTLNVTIDGKPGEMDTLDTYFQQMVVDMDNDQVEMFDV
jgi:hypothetical protein